MTNTVIGQVSFGVRIELSQARPSSKGSHNGHHDDSRVCWIRRSHRLGSRRQSTLDWEGVCHVWKHQPFWSASWLLHGSKNSAEDNDGGSFRPSNNAYCEHHLRGCVELQPGHCSYSYTSRWYVFVAVWPRRIPVSCDEDVSNNWRRERIDQYSHGYAVPHDRFFLWHCFRPGRNSKHDHTTRSRSRREEGMPELWLHIAVRVLVLSRVQAVVQVRFAKLPQSASRCFWRVLDCSMHLIGAASGLQAGV